eukprot:TRINITY_DN113792_c0_g1_i1.p1 TRINITY_DN113792_c0_g1~~TRINITY_DN113792_c0_g1_i1.p1  ORF type:complete len:557 (+),score=57.86 TRINITY_DN113792_c0_g1_i1:224-1672(+)
MADSIEVGVITFLETSAEKEWELHGFEKNALAIVVFIGEFLGCFVWGPLSDRIGRRPAFMCSNLALVFFGCLSAAAPSFWSLVVLRGLVGVSIGGIVIPFDNLLETVEDKHKDALGYAMEFWWTGGTLYVTGIAAVSLSAAWGGWRIFALLSTIPIVLVCFGFFFLDESPVWLQDVGCNEEAMEVLKKAAKINGKDISGITLVAYEREAEPSISEIFSPSFRRRTCSLAFIWLLGFFGYYGASLANSFIFQEGDDINYGEIAFASSGEIIGVIFAMLASRRWGGMSTLAVSYFIAGAASLGVCIAFVLKDSMTVPTVVVALLAFFLRLGGMAGSSAIWVVTPPAYPTHVRSTAHSFMFGAGRIGGLCATLWPASTPVAVIMATYAIANCCTAMIGYCEGRQLEQNGAFESLAADLQATDLDRRSRSIASRSARLSTGFTGRPSLFRSGRVSATSRHGRQSLPPRSSEAPREVAAAAGVRPSM